MRDLDDLLAELVSEIRTLNNRVDELERQPAPIGDGSAQYQYIVTGATPFKPGYSAGYLDIAAGQTLRVTTGGILVLGGYTLTVPATGTPALMDYANAGDFYTVAWTNYFATSTKIGWSSFATQQYILYKKVGKLVFVQYDIDGTSNSVATTFTLPYTLSSLGAGAFGALYTTDAGAAQAGPGWCQINNGASLATFYKDWTGLAWTAAGYKRIYGEVFFQAA